MLWEFKRCSLQSTVLKEVWTRLYQLAHEAGNDEDSDPRVARLNKRILSSLRPDKTMVFVLDLMRSGKSPTQHVVPLHSCSHCKFSISPSAACVHTLHVISSQESCHDYTYWFQASSMFSI